MGEILDFQKLREMAMPVIDIPNFDGTGIIKVRAQKPRLMALAAQGKIPNHLMNIATKMVTGNSSKEEEKGEGADLKEAAKMMELYCQACLVEPTYDEFKEIMTDEQMMAIFNWAMGEAKQLDSFRTNKEDGANNNDGETLPEKTE